MVVRVIRIIVRNERDEINEGDLLLVNVALAHQVHQLKAG